jgi:hypothetical protein
MKHNLTAVMVLLAACRSPGPPIERCVDAPIDLSSAKALKRQGMAVTIERKTPGKKSESELPSCGSECGGYIFAVPFLLLARLGADAPYDEVIARRGDQVMYRGEFTTEGTLIEAVLTRDQTVHRIQPVWLEHLHKTVLVEVERMPLLPDGTLGPATHLSIEKQCPQLPAVRKRLAKEPGNWGPIVRGAFSDLGIDALPLAEEATADQRADLADSMCERAEFAPVLAPLLRMTATDAEAAQMVHKIEGCSNRAWHNDLVHGYVALLCDEKTKDGEVERLARKLVGFPNAAERLRAYLPGPFPGEEHFRHGWGGGGTGLLDKVDCVPARAELLRNALPLPPPTPLDGNPARETQTAAGSKRKKSRTAAHDQR